MGTMSRLASVMLLASLPVAAQQNLYAVDGGYHNGQTWIFSLRTLDPSAVPHAVIHQVSLDKPVHQLCTDGSSLFALSTETIFGPVLLVRINPADGTTTEIGVTGLPPMTIPPSSSVDWERMDVNPLTGEIYAVVHGRLYHINKNNGAATFLVTLLSPYLVHAIAFDATGTAWGTGGTTLYQIDLLGGSVIPWGNLGLAILGFEDLAFDSAGSLWASTWGSGGPSTGLYRIDVNNLTATLVTPLPHSLFGIAFGPALPVHAYCTAKTNSLGCTPAIGGRGLASASAKHGFDITGRNVLSGTFGVLTFGTSGKAALPFLGGTLCMAGPFVRLPVTPSGGTPPPAQDCTGLWSVDFNAWLWNQQPHPQLQAGTMIDCQWWGRDPGLNPPGSVSLTNALEFTLYP